MSRSATFASGFHQSDLNALLASNQFTFADAITLRLVNDRFAGINLFYTNHQQSFTAPACDGTGLTTYITDVLVDGLKLKLTSGKQDGNDPTTTIETDEQNCTFTPNVQLPLPPVIVGTPFLQAVRQRALDGAVVQRDRWFFNAAGQPVGGYPMFYGYASSIDSLSRTQAVMKVKSALVLLNIQMPRNLFQPNCIYTVYSSGCGAVKSSFVNHATVGSSPAPTRSFIPWVPPANTPFANGEVFFSSGPNVNVTRTIRAFDTTGLYLAYPLPFTPATGDLFNAYPGCNRKDPLVAGSTSDCIFFSRTAAFRATPRVPETELAL